MESSNVRTLNFFQHICITFAFKLHLCNSEIGNWKNHLEGPKLVNIRMSFPQKYQWCITDKERLEKDWLLINNKNFMLALFDPGGHCALLSRICV